MRNRVKIRSLKLQFKKNYIIPHTASNLTGAFGGLGGCQGNAAQTEQFEEGGCLLVELTQLSLCSRQVDAAETQHGNHQVVSDPNTVHSEP